MLFEVLIVSVSAYCLGICAGYYITKRAYADQLDRLERSKELLERLRRGK